MNPLLATAAEILRRHPGASVEAIGTASGLEATLVPAAGHPLTFIPRVRIPRRPSLEMLTLPGRLRSAINTTADVIARLRPDVVVGFGGDLSAPAYRAAFAAGVPVVVHEQNARPGLANRYAARRAAVVALTFASTPLRARAGRRVVTGLPLRPPVAALVRDRAAGQGESARALAAAELGLDPGAPILLITGGSLGAASINAAAAGALPRLAAATQVLHLTGRGKAAGVHEAHLRAGSPPSYRVLEYLTDMQLAYACADLVVTRAGAGMVAELSALGIPAIYVPLPVGNGEQRLNAADVVAAGGGILIEDADLDPAGLTAAALPLLRDPAALNTMGRLAAGAGPGDGAALLVDEIEAIA